MPNTGIPPWLTPNSLENVNELGSGAGAVSVRFSVWSPSAIWSDAEPPYRLDVGGVTTNSHAPGVRSIEYVPSAPVAASSHGSEAIGFEKFSCGQASTPAPATGGEPGWLPLTTLPVSVPRFTPDPSSDTVCGLSEALSVNVSVPLRSPAAVGLKSSVTAQAPEPGTDGTQVSLTIEKLAAPVPVIVGETLSVSVP